MQGRVRILQFEKRFGFITSSEGDFFFHREDFQGHWNDLEIDYRTGQTIIVEFEKVPNPAKGPRAMNVKRIEHPNEG